MIRHRHFTCIVVSLALFLMSGCGFQPLYGTNGATPRPTTTETLSQIKISIIPDREGQMLRNALIDRFYKNGWPASPRYILVVKPLKESIRNLDITKSSDATRAQLRVNTAMTLRDMQTGKPVLERNISAITSYNILQSQFTTRVSEDNARQNAIEDLADQIETRLVLYFNRQP